MEKIPLKNIQAILKDKSPQLTEELAQQAARLTRQYFGRTISLYTPLYLSNYCSSHCTYCGFSRNNKIQRRKLTAEQMHREMKNLAETGIENILLLTGESPQTTPLSYLKEAVKIAKEYFTCISLEVFPMTTDEYHQLFLGGVDGITIYQETYDRTRYEEVHLAGQKRDYDFRYKCPERIASAGMRQISMGVLLGLGNLPSDLHALYCHAADLERRYPGVEYSLSFPRLRKIKGTDFCPQSIDDTTFIKIICLTRMMFPRFGINLSTRESPRLRDHALELGVTRLSAGSNTAVGGYSLLHTEGQDPQFDISDHRSVQDMIQILKFNNFDPILTDWRPIINS